MTIQNRSRRARDVRPVLLALEERALLNGAMPSLTLDLKPAVHVSAVKAAVTTPVFGFSDITIIGTANSKGYHFVNFDGPNAGNTAGTGTNMNGISNSGIAVGFTISNTGTFTNFTADHAFPSLGRVLVNPATPNAQAFGINTAGVVVGTDGNNNAAFLYRGALKTFIPFGGSSAIAFGINDQNTIVGQYTTATASPGFVRFSNGKFLTINAPSGPNIVFAQGVDNRGLIVGFYIGNDGQDHGFIASTQSARNGVIQAVPVADPVIPTVAGEPGATFVFSQILGINDRGIAVELLRRFDPTSQHGFLLATSGPASIASLTIPPRRSTTAWKSPRSRGSRIPTRSRDSTPRSTASSSASGRVRYEPSAG